MTHLDSNMEVMDRSPRPGPTRTVQWSKSALLKAANPMPATIEEMYPTRNFQVDFSKKRAS